MPTALLFPGQGSQRVGMGADLFDASPAARAVLARAEAICALPIARLCVEGPEERLRATEVAQPALVAVEVAALAALAERIGAEGPVEAAARLGTGWVAGHSLGEYAACVAAGALSVDDGLRLAGARGRLMADAPEGAMAAVLGLDAAAVAALCQEVGGTVVVANDNAPGQIVISGERAAVERAGAAAKAAGASRVVPLNVSGGFHSPLMAEAAERFAAEIASVEVRAPRWPLVGNTVAAPIVDAAGIRAELAAQIAAPVRWRETMAFLAAEGADRAFECGPGAVLAGLARRGAPALPVRSLGSWADVLAVAAELQGESA